MLEKKYQAATSEHKWYEHWEKSGAFKGGQRPDAETYSIVLPPPNVTGSLHIGHALNHTLQDILIRFERMRGKDVLWQPGMDHAGIATQMVVERQLDAQGVSRYDLGREKFLERVWEWKEESGGTIFNQMRRLGQSCDWSRQRFTMDDGFSEAVLKVFVKLHEEGLIYKDKRLVNWDPKLKTAISDLEVEQKEVNGHFWHFRYPVEEEEGRYIVVATTRPETMLGDTAVAVHPDDERHKDLIGKYLILPLVGRRILVVADEHADPEQGSGAVKITPAHDFNDFVVGQRHNLEKINILDENACLNENVPEKYQGLDRYAARSQIVADMEAAGYLEKIEERLHTVPYGDRSGVVIEPWLTDQWYVNAAELAKPAIKAVEDGQTKFVPKQWEKTYFEWMYNIEPWCISRQLWWGHRIPAWYGPDGEIFVALSEEQAQEKARKHYGEDKTLTRDPDVLDTWFSSALWPFGTLGWPEDTKALERFYKTDVLVTGFDIIFFWVARMMMDGLHFMRDEEDKAEVPFHTVYVHALVRDEHGQKMSKSKGNVIDPLELVDNYGADALRFTLAAMAAQGRDLKLSEKRVEGYRNFVTKLWNAARFCEMHDCHGAGELDLDNLLLTNNKWIVGEVTKTASNLNQALEDYRFNEAAGAIYHFTWGTFCDWFIELSKPLLNGDNVAEKIETRQTAAWVLDQILKMLHPFMPFVTEELWQSLSSTRETDLIVAPWPELSSDLINNNASEEMNWAIALISEIRTGRAEMNVPAGAKIEMHIQGANESNLKALSAHEEVIKRLARISDIICIDGEGPKGSAQIVIKEATVFLPLAGVIDVEQEQARLTKSLDKIEKEMGGIKGRLNNEKFISKAPESVVAENKSNLADAEEKAAKLRAALARLASLAQ
ncbi:MAG: valine--tRNA ligase [Kordiimonas sp.]|nr:valine--tRNA ligase [Kordiimonas sp.]|tara:strand:+ start:1400 stop:4075 length:2676 start_codon:yes stop_codon:yes gene_type:complete